MNKIGFCLALCIGLAQIQPAFSFGQSVFQKPGKPGAAQVSANTQSLPPGAPNPRAVGLYNLGLTAYKQGSPESAIIFFRRACDIDPNLADAQYNLGVIYQTQKRYKEAISRFQEVLRLKNEDPDANFQLGVVLQELARYDEAKQHLLAIAPNNIHFADAQKRIAVINSMPAQPQTNNNAASNLLAPPIETNPVSQNNGQSRAVDNSIQQSRIIESPLNTIVSQPPTAPDFSRSDFSNANSEASNTTVANSTSPTLGNSNAYNSTLGNSTAYNSNATNSIANPTFVNQMNVPNNTNVPSNNQLATLPSSASPSSPIPTVDNISLRIIASGFSAPAGLAFDKIGNMFVANFMTNTIDRISPEGTKTLFSSGVNLRGPIGLAVDDSNNLYVANYNSGTIARITPAGISTVIASGFSKPYYLTLDNQGNLYVSQQEDNSIVRIILPTRQK